MNGALFALVCKENDDKVFAWGMEVTIDEDPETETAARAAVVYRPSLDTTHSMLSTHSSAEDACAAYNRIVPVDLEWDADHWYTAFAAEPPAASTTP